MKKFASLILVITLIFSSFLCVQAKSISNRLNALTKPNNLNVTKNAKNTALVPNTSSAVIPVISINNDTETDIKTSEKINKVPLSTKEQAVQTPSPTSLPETVKTPQSPTNNVNGKFNVSSKDIKFYNSNLKEFVAIPITYITSKNSTQIVPKYTTSKSGTSIEVIVDDSILSSSYTKDFNTMKKSISIQSLEGNKTKVSITFLENIDVDVYRTSNNPKISGNRITNRDFLVFSFFDKTMDSSSITAPTNGNQVQTQGDFKKPKSNYLITIDPGHGGKQPGACAAGMKEKDLTLDISLKVRDLLLSQGYDIYMIRDNDTGVDLYDRATASNIMKSDLFMSIHINANGTSSYNGTTVLYNSKAKNPAKQLAEFMRDSISNAIGTKKLRLEDRPKLIVLNSTNSPSILIEVAVLTNSSDAQKLKNKNCIQTIANTITSSLNVYFGFEPTVPSK